MGHSERQSATLRYPRPDHFFYARHFLLLACFSALLGVMRWLRPSLGLFASFAVYGALHATGLALALGARLPWWRRGLFIVLAAGLSIMALRVGLFVGGLSATLGPGAPYAVFGFSATAGAVTYGILIRRVGIFELTLRELALISCGCALAADLAYVILAHWPTLGRWWLAVFWWFAFSGGLWYCDRRRCAVIDGSRTVG
ncbi:MAG TPA: hypothetical protein VNZ53_50410 [Steroidobacteraceae bacterium]|nr:hypothetical protein [Steroidobacteraceae bacterium]